VRDATGIVTHAGRASAWQGRARWPGPTALAVFALALCVYIPTLAPGLLWGGGDFATFQTRLYTGELTGTIFGHPLWVILARPFLYLPIRDVAYRANLASAFFGAGALAFVFLCAWQLTRRTGPSLLATCALLVSHTFWTYSVMPKVYSLNTLLAAILYLLLRWGQELRPATLYAAAALAGLSLLNHLLMATAVAGIAAYVLLILRREPRTQAARRQLLLAGGCFALGLLPYLAIVVTQNQGNATSGTIVGSVRDFLISWLHPIPLLLGIGVGVALLVYQFPVTFIGSALGLHQMWRAQRPEAILMALVAGGDVMFILGATVPSTSGDYVWNLHYYLPTYVVLALWLAAGLTAFWPQINRSAVRLAGVAFLTLGLPVVVYLLAPSLARPFVEGLPGFRSLPGRDNLTYVLWPWKQNETGARPFGEGILAALPPDSQLFADYSIWTVVNYLQIVDRERPDVTIYNLTEAGDQLQYIQQHAGSARMYLADVNRYYRLDAIRTRFEVVPAGAVYQLVPK
jgi:hypothetical protein